MHGRAWVFLGSGKKYRNERRGACRDALRRFFVGILSVSAGLCCVGFRAVLSGVFCKRFSRVIFECGFCGRISSADFEFSGKRKKRKFVFDSYRQNTTILDPKRHIWILFFRYFCLNLWYNIRNKKICRSIFNRKRLILLRILFD